MRNGMLGLIAVVLLGGCSTSLRGYLSYGTESMTFRDCRSGAIHWLGEQAGDPAQWAAIHAIVNDASACGGERWGCLTPDAPVEVRGRLSDAGAHGPFGQTGRRLDIETIRLLTGAPCLAETP
ncbi:hypothetical protein [Ferrimonas balearica]|uniref:hypothetical protein n=1 Tax=Ferrimonas balearica TaxID=44012 RepID=UPI001C98F10A|nr:hypothetical protein [Ferrimonas balearica]MBY5992994.1 hypothetical protein [Ferrimonas balearica]